MSTHKTHRNALVNETSLYLRQHAHNPVQWHAWNEVSLQMARESGKPILLSIGYSACHWCHVMAHESFEDDATAEIMNEHFINIKVDREERPDLDKIYQLAHQIMTQRPGGWPLTMFLTHDEQMPFFGGTYFPPAPRHGLPAFPELLLRVAQFYQERNTELQQQNIVLKNIFAEQQPTAGADAVIDADPMQVARATLESQFDKEFGGFGGAPKFPHPRTLEFLLRHWHASSSATQPDLHALFMSALTLTRMAEGGLFDQLGGGFFRYSVDRYWMIPHFEKMLYDNAELLRIYSFAFTASGDALFKHAASATAQWLLRDMRSPSGSFWSTLDADSEGEEGKFYGWALDQFKLALNETEFKVIEKRYGLDTEPNFTEHGPPRWHLHAYRSMDEVAKELNLSLEDASHELQHAHAKLLTIRSARVWPGRDEKILTSWNALAIGALAIASRSLNESSLAVAAHDALDQLRLHAWKNGQLYAVQSGGQPRFPAYLDDYAYLLDAVIEVLQLRWSDPHLQFAVELADKLLSDFLDEAQGGCFFTAHHHEQLINRPKSFSDDATPAGNSIAAHALLKLGYLLGDSRYLDVSEKIIRAGWLSVQRYPSAHASMLNALSDFLTPVQIIIIRGQENEIMNWQHSLSAVFRPGRMIFAIPDGASLPEALAIKSTQSQTIAYVCNGQTCSEPIKSLDALIALSR